MTLQEELKALNAQLDSNQSIVARLNELANKFRQAKTSKDRAPIVEEYNKLVAEYMSKEKELATRQKALLPQVCNAYNASEGKDVELRDFLLLMQYALIAKNDNYEAAYDLTKLLLSYPLPEDAVGVHALGALAAFNTMNLDDADEWTAVAKENGGIDQADPTGELQLKATLENLRVSYRANWEKEQKIREKEANDNLPQVEFNTTKGKMVFELFLNEAPNAVNNFLSLVDKGFYNGVVFHRVLDHFMAQGGDPTGRGTGGPGYCIPCECYQDNARDHFRGSLSMAHAGRDTGGSQFFITFVPTYFLNGKHTVFGRVIEGFDVLSEIQRVDPERPTGEEIDKIVDAKILRGQVGEFKKAGKRW